MGEDTETEMDMRTRLVVQYKEQAEDNVSSLSLGDQSYILDLSNQRQFRAECRREEAMEDALELYQAAIEEGAPEGVELFQIFMATMLKELNEENREKDRLQDEWLEAALQEELDRQQQRANGLNVSNHTLLSKSNHSRRSERSKSLSGPPSIFNGRRPTLSMRRQSSIRMLELDIKIHDEEKNILHKKINKAERLIQQLIDEKGVTAAKATIKYKNLHKKVKEYKSTLQKAAQDDLKFSRHSKARSVMYDWGAVDDDEKTEQVEDDDSSSLSSSSSSTKSGDKNSSRFNDAEFEWAKQVVAKLNLDVDDNPIEGPSTDNVAATTETDKIKRTPNKNISFSTVNATTRRMSGHELRTKAMPGIQCVNETRFIKHPLPVPEEEEEADETGSTQVSVGSESTPHQRAHDVPQSPGKRKSPSWKDAENIKFSPVKQLVSQFQEKEKKKSIGSPPLATTGSPQKKIIERRSVGYPPLTNNRLPEVNPVERRPVGYLPLTSNSSPEKKPVVRKSIGSPPLANNSSAEEKQVETIIPGDSPSSDVDTISNIPVGTCYTMEDFKQGKVSNIDLSDWEQFLSNSEFEKNFGMTRAAFDKLPKWKKMNAKRVLRTW